MTSGHLSPDHDDMSTLAGTALPGWMGDALRSPIPPPPERRARLLAQVRALSSPPQFYVPAGHSRSTVCERAARGPGGLSGTAAACRGRRRSRGLLL